MGAAAAEPVLIEKGAESRGHETVAPQAAAGPGFDPFLERLVQGSPADPPEAAARSLSAGNLKAPILQRAQRWYGNRVSQQIVMRAGALQRKCDCGGTCAKCEEEEERLLQRKSRAAHVPDVDVIPTTLGEPLDANSRQPLERHFGTGLADVRVHTGSQAAESATRLDALAYTSGRDIYFAPGMYSPSSSTGRRLLAHEVAHVVQQSSGKEPSIAAKSAHGVRIGAPDDPLESEADREAEQFMTGAPPQLTDEEQRRQRESGAVQRFVQRQPNPSPAPATPSPASPAPADAGPAPPQPTPQAPPVPAGEIVKTIDGVQLVEDPVFMRYQMEQLVIQGGGNDYHWFSTDLEHDVETDAMAGDRAFKKQFEENPSSVSAGVPLQQEDFDTYDQLKEKERRVLDIVRPIVSDLDREQDQVVGDFEKLAKERANTTLDESEKQEQSEAARYGIKWEAIEVMKADCAIGDCKDTQTRYSMGEQSPAVTGLQGAAQVLLTRRNELDQAHAELDQAQREYLDFLAGSSGEGAGTGDMDHTGIEPYAERRTAAEEKYKWKKDHFDLMQGYLSTKYPILAVFSDLEKSTSDLQKLINQTAGPEMAALIGKEIVDRLNNIAKVRRGLNDSKEVNVWRLPELVGITRELMGVNQKPVWKKWIDEKVEQEQPGILAAIALAVLNLGAILAAPFTGGVSLLVAAGVNAVVAVEHVKEYQMQKALSGTAFDKAHALSQDDPSWFWLAVEVVGVGIDAISAFKAIAAAAKALKAAEEAGDAVRIARETEQLEKVAGNEALARSIARQLEEKAGGEKQLLKALDVTADEKGLLEAGTQAAEAELKAGLATGEALEEGGVQISRSGHIFVCHSPCEWMISKYADLLGPEITLEGEATSLNAQYVLLEEEASKAAAVVRNAAPEHLAEAEKAAAAVEAKVAAFDQKLAKEAAYSQASKKFASLNPDAAANLLKLEKDAAIRFSGLTAESLERIGQLSAGSLNKLASWGLDGAAIERILAKGANAGHIKGQLLEELLNIRMAEPGAIAKHVPAGLLKQLEKQGAKLEFIPGHAITDANGQLISDGLIGYYEGDQFKIVTFFEAKGGAPAARGLRYSWTGIPKAERADLFKKAQDIGLSVLRDDQEFQGLAEALSEAASDVKAANKAAAKLTLDEVIKQYPDEVQKAWSKLPQSEAGQIRKTTERLTEGGGTLRINGKEVQTATIGGRAPSAVGVLPSGVAEKGLEDTLRSAGIRNFERLEDLPQAELNSMADELAATGTKP